MACMLSSLNLNANDSVDYKSCLKNAQGETYSILSCIDIETRKVESRIKSLLTKEKYVDQVVDIVKDLEGYYTLQRELISNKCDTYNKIYPGGQGALLLEKECILSSMESENRLIEDIISTAEFEYGN